MTYETFFSSLKARGHVADDVMCAYGHLFNEEAKQCASKKPFIKKIMFNSIISISVSVNFVLSFFPRLFPFF